MAIDLDYCFVNPNLFDFKADTLRKAIVKLHRLNASCHSSPDDWALNMLEATKDLQDEDSQTKFYQYISNPSGFTENKELWDALEKFDQEHTDPTVIRDVQHDVWDDSNFVQESKNIGHTQYIYVKNKEWTPPTELEQELGRLDAIEEKICDAD
jgi:hypothetical protein